MSTQTRQVAVKAPPERVWAALSDFGGGASWAPTVLKAECITTPDRGAGARCVLHHRSGRTVEEVVLDWSDARCSFTFEVPGGLGPFKSVREAWSVAAEADGSRVTVTMSLSMKYGLLAPVLDALFGRRLMGRELALSLAGLKRYVETGQTEKDTARLPTSAVRQAGATHREV